MPQHVMPKKGVFLFHKNCRMKWYCGPFEKEPDAWNFAEAKLCDRHSCPGCGTPTAGTPTEFFDVEKITD